MDYSGGSNKSPSSQTRRSFPISGQRERMMEEGAEDAAWLVLKMKERDREPRHEVSYMLEKARKQIPPKDGPERNAALLTAPAAPVSDFRHTGCEMTNSRGRSH